MAPPPLPSEGAVVGFISFVNSLLKPVQHLRLYPPYPALAEPDPPGELPDCFKASYVLRRIQDQLL